LTRQIREFSCTCGGGAPTTQTIQHGSDIRRYRQCRRCGRRFVTVELRLDALASLHLDRDRLQAIVSLVREVAEETTGRTAVVKAADEILASA
jgi:hypothetical protein